EERTAELREAQDRLVRKERLAAVGQVTGTVSHELRNPLGAIRSGIDAMKKLAEAADPRMARIIALLDRSERRCNRVIADLLDFTRVRELELHPTRVDDWLGALLDEQNLPPQVTLRRQLGSGAELPLDRDRIERALRNVIENACHAMEAAAERDGRAEEHHLTVAARAEEGRLEISVADTGVGIAADERAKVFEPLFSTKSFGVGLGLPMVKQTLEQHGGNVEIRTDLERGTEVVLWLPLSESQRGAAA
ncbi:MAG: ATP-binding protein, partial [Rhodospirillales bacterium]|nr:ATP-binding protein [Rhodospirillales bacterium]